MVEKSGSIWCSSVIFWHLINTIFMLGVTILGNVDWCYIGNAAKKTLLWMVTPSIVNVMVPVVFECCHGP